MAKRNLVMLVAVLLTTLAAPTNAQSPGFGESCVLLGEVVRQAAVNEILSNRGESPFPAPRSITDAQGLHACNSTTSVVSSAFGTALGQFGIHIRWSYLSTGNGLACLNHDISLCHPFAEPMGPPVSPADLVFIGNSWGRLRGGVATFMPWGISSDISYFRADTLTRSLQPGAQGPVLPGVGSIPF